MRDAAIETGVLEMDEPPLSRRIIDDRALVRAVDRRLSLLQNDLRLVRAINILRSEDELPAILHAAGGRGNDVPAVTLVEIGALERRLLIRFVVDDFTLAEEFRCIRRHR